MMSLSPPAAKQTQQLQPLRFIVCDAVDGGVPSLVERLLSNELSVQHRQGLASDVAYRVFSADKRKFMAAEIPGNGHDAYRLAAAASTAQLAIIVVDAGSDLSQRIRLNSFIIRQFGIGHLIVAINNMDAVDFSPSRAAEIEADWREYAGRLGFKEDNITCIPVSIQKGDNLTEPSQHMDWYHGPTLLAYLESVDTGDEEAKGPFRMPVQEVKQPGDDMPGIAGSVALGSIAIGDAVRILPSSRVSKISRIVTMDGDIDSAAGGQPVRLLLDDDRDIALGDIAPGDIVCSAAEPAEVADQFQAVILSVSDQKLHAGRSYTMNIAGRSLSASITEYRHKINTATLDQQPARRLQRNEVALANIATQAEIAFDPYETCRETGGFVLIDQITNETVGVGTLNFALRRAHNIHRHVLDVSKQSRAAQKLQKPVILWFTGLSGSGKSTIANALEKRLQADGRHTYLLDGDNVRHGLNRDLGFTDTDRVENIRRIAEVAKLMVDAGLIVLVSFISPFRSERDFARGLVEQDEFLEVFIDTPLEVAEARDPKGLYQKARRGEIANFTGISSPYEAPQNPDIRLAADRFEAEESAEKIMAYLIENQYTD